MKRWYRRPVVVFSVLVLTVALSLSTSAWHHDTVLEQRFERINTV